MKTTTIAFITTLNLLTLFSPTAIYASSTATPDPQRQSLPGEDQQARPCDQGCFYRRGNENVRLQSQYIFNRIQALESKYRDRKGVLDSDGVLKELGPFCLKDEKNGGYAESGEACFERYKTLSVLQLYKMRGAIIKNYDSVTKLNSKAEAFVMPQPENATKKKAQIPHLPTYKELENEYRKAPRPSEAEYKAWVKSLYQQPDQTDFVKYKLVPSDPNNPKSDSIITVETGPAGQALYDDKVYKKATKFYTDRKLEIESYQQKALRGANPLPPTKLTGSLTEDTSKEAYSHARDYFIEIVGPGLVNGKIHNPLEKNFLTTNPAQKEPKGSDRAPAKDSTKDPTKDNDKNEIPLKDMRTKPDAEDLYITVNPDIPAGFADSLIGP